MYVNTLYILLRYLEYETSIYSEKSADTITKKCVHSMRSILCYQT